MCARTSTPVSSWGRGESALSPKPSAGHSVNTWKAVEPTNSFARQSESSQVYRRVNGLKLHFLLYWRSANLVTMTNCAKVEESLSAVSLGRDTQYKCQQKWEELGSVGTLLFSRECSQIFKIMYMSVLPACMFMHHTSAYRSQNRALDPQERSYQQKDGYKHGWYWKATWIRYKSKYPEPSISPGPIKMLFVGFSKNLCVCLWTCVSLCAPEE